jgi:O-methyltransferase/methyltransferase family protein
MPGSTPAAALRTQVAGQILGFVVSQAVYVAARLGIADQLAEGPRSAMELAVSVGADPEGLYRLLRLLAGNGIFVEQANGDFVNSPASELLRDTPGSLRTLALQAGEVGYPAMGVTRHMVQTGEPAFDKAFGAVWEEHLATDRQARRRFNRLVRARNEVLVDHLGDHLADQLRTGQETVIDVGGGDGALLQGLLERRTGLRGIVFDLPEVVAEAAERLRRAGLAHRCQTVAGSFFRGVPGGGDVYILCSVLHSWGNDQAQEILQAVRRAIPDHGLVLVVEEILAPPNQPGGKLMDLLMATIGGRQRTRQEWRVLLADSGFALTRSRPVHSVTILDAVPTSPRVLPLTAAH